jgi:hypothetical protein
MVIGFIDHLQIVTTSDYSAVANSLILQLTTTHIKPFYSAVHRLQQFFYCCAFIRCVAMTPSLMTSSRAYCAIAQQWMSSLVKLLDCFTI